MSDKRSQEDRQRDTISDERSQEDRQRDSEKKKKDPQGKQPVEKPGFAWGDPKEGTGSQSGGSEGGLGGG